MRTVEVSAKTREEAVEDALRQLKAERHEVHVEILDQGSSGFFGLGARPARLRVTLEREGAGEEEAAAAPSRRGQDTGAAEGRTGRRGGRDANRRGRERDTAAESGAEPRSKRRGRREDDESEARPAPRKDSAAEPEHRSEPRERTGAGANDSGLEAAALLQTIIKHMGIEAKVTCGGTDEGVLRLNVASEDSAILIGRKGQTLGALQYLLNRMLADAGDESADLERVVIDIEGYLDRRQASLEEMARETGDRVRETGKRVRLKPMTPQERRIVHLALQDDPEIKTYSVGNAQLRSVVVAPAGEAEESGDSPEPEKPQRSANNRRRGRPQGGASSGGASGGRGNRGSGPKPQRQGNRGRGGNR